MAMSVDDTNEAERFHVGSTIAGRYRVERPIGEGAMGAVALARHVSLDETVAIKFLKPEHRRDPVAVARLSREAKALARIKSDHVARVLDVGMTLSVGPYMVMEYLEGIDLGELLDTEGPLPVPRAVEVVLQVCEALTVAHTAGIVHRDIKPQNLFLARHGQFETLKVLDFGIAEDSRISLADLSEQAPESVRVLAPSRGAGPLYGTPSYMSPERVRNEPSQDHRSDIWSVGVVLHELVTGCAPFDGANLTETCARIVSDEPPALETRGHVLPASLRAIIQRCLERDPAQRYQSVEELVAALAPLSDMQERFRGRSTGTFSRRMVEEELARVRGVDSRSTTSRSTTSRSTTSRSTTSRSTTGAPVAGWRAALQQLDALLRGWVDALPISARVSAFTQQAGIGMASLLVAGVAALLIGGIAWMAPPPGESSLHAEPVRIAPPAPKRSLGAAVVVEAARLGLEPSSQAASGISPAAPEATEALLTPEPVSSAGAPVVLPTVSPNASSPVALPPGSPAIAPRVSVPAVVAAPRAAAAGAPSVAPQRSGSAERRAAPARRARPAESTRSTESTRDSTRSNVRPPASSAAAPADPRTSLVHPSRVRLVDDKLITNRPAAGREPTSKEKADAAKKVPEKGASPRAIPPPLPQRLQKLPTERR